MSASSSSSSSPPPTPPPPPTAAAAAVDGERAAGGEAPPQEQVRCRAPEPARRVRRAGGGRLRGGRPSERLEDGSRPRLVEGVDAGPANDALGRVPRRLDAAARLGVPLAVTLHGDDRDAQPAARGAERHERRRERRQERRRAAAAAPPDAASARTSATRTSSAIDAQRVRAKRPSSLVSPRVDLRRRRARPQQPRQRAEPMAEAAAALGADAAPQRRVEPKRPHQLYDKGAGELVGERRWRRVRRRALHQCAAVFADELDALAGGRPLDDEARRPRQAAPPLVLAAREAEREARDRVGLARFHLHFGPVRSRVREEDLGAGGDVGSRVEFPGRARILTDGGGGVRAALVFMHRRQRRRHAARRSERREDRRCNSSVVCHLRDATRRAWRSEPSAKCRLARVLQHICRVSCCLGVGAFVTALKVAAVVEAARLAGRERRERE